VNSQYPLQAFNEYILYERRAKHPDLFVTRGVYERAIAEAAKQRFDGQANAEDILHVFWAGYCDALVRLLYLVIPILRTCFQAATECGS
jgi:hypothetical protein